MITLLKRRGISFINGMPILPSDSIYTDIPLMIETYAHRNDIPNNMKSHSLISYFYDDSNLINRLLNVEKELPVLKQYGGICGFDLSPCITMLRPRQKLSLLASALFNCYVAINGVKVLINGRTGDLATMSCMDNVTKGSNIISGEIGRHGHEYRYYGRYQLKLSVETVDPKILFICGHLSQKDIAYVCGNRDRVIIMYPGRRHRMRDNKKVVVIKYSNGEYYKCTLDEYLQKRGVC